MGIILASASPRRSELMQQIGVNFTVKVSNVEETIEEGIAPVEVAERLAWLKAVDIAELHPDDTVIGADTIVVLDNRILGKPKSAQDAHDMLKALSGSTHKVITGIAVINKSLDKAICTREVTDVFFKGLNEEEISQYVATQEPMDKAGAYAIQGRAAVFVTRIEGCYFNVVGLPLFRLAKILKEFGV